MALPFAPRRLRLALLQQQLGVARNQEYLILAGIIVAIELDRPGFACYLFLCHCKGLSLPVFVEEALFT